MPGGAGGCRRRVAVVRSTSSPRAPPCSGASARPPSPETGVARRPASQGRLARRRRPALRGALRLVGFAPDGYPPPAPPSPALPAPWNYSRSTRLAYPVDDQSASGGGRGRGHPPWTRIFCALTKRKTRVSWPVKSAEAGRESAWSTGDAPAPSRRFAGTWRGRQRSRWALFSSLLVDFGLVA